MLKNNHGLEHNVRFSVMLEEATRGVLEKKVFLKVSILKVAVEILRAREFSWNYGIPINNHL